MNDYHPNEPRISNSEETNYRGAATGRFWPNGNHFLLGQDESELREAWAQHRLATKPPKKKHTGLKVFAAIVAGVILLLGIASAIGSPAQDAGGKAVTFPDSATPTGSAAQTKTPKPPASPVKPAEEAPPAKLVKGHKVGPFTLAASVKLTRSGLGSFDAKINAVNTSGEEQMAIFKITVLKGDDILGTLDCIGGGGNPIPAGRTMTAACISSDDYKKGWSQVQLEHTGF